jgi:hypothetical protein
MNDMSERDYFQMAFGLCPEDMYLAVPGYIPWDQIVHLAEVISNIKIVKKQRKEFVLYERFSGKA